MSLSSIRAGIAAALAGESYHVYPNAPATPEMPCVIVGFPTEIEFDQTLSGSARYTMVITVLVSMADVEHAEIELDTIITGDLPNALNEYHPETPAWRAMHVEGVTNVRPESVGPAGALAADFNLTFLS